MKEVSRRGFITQASVVGAAAAVAGFATLPSAAEASQKSSRTPVTPTHAFKGPVPEDVVLHIRDAHKGEVAVIAGYDEVVFTDHRLVSSILSHAAHGTKE